MRPRSVDYDDWHEAQQVEGEDEGRALWHRLTDKYLDDVRSLHVLEIGCGRGGYASRLAERGAFVVAADFSPAAVDQARIALATHSNAEAVVADIQHLPFADESFDVVISLETLEHVPEPQKALAELVRVTRRGGRLLITTPNYLSLRGLVWLAFKLMGRTYTELGQPFTRPLTLVGRVYQLRKLGCRVDAADGEFHAIPIPRYRSVRLPLDRPRWIMRWFGIHSVTAATRL